MGEACREGTHVRLIQLMPAWHTKDWCRLPMTHKVHHRLCVCFCVSKVCNACRLVKDKNTQKLKGTAFVEYERPEDAQRAAEACAKAR